jgi:pimeloyl-ACP methyl ester carboxylesterase
MHSVDMHARGSHQETIVFLHSSGASARQWDLLVPYLDERIEVLTPDLLGYGNGKVWPLAARATLTDEAEHVKPLLDAHPGGVHVVGHSFGGAVALQLALRWPRRVKTLTLFEPVRFALLLGHASTAAAGEAIRQLGEQVLTAVAAGLLARAAEHFIDYWCGEGTWQAIPALRQQQLAARMPKVCAEIRALFEDRMPDVAYRHLEIPVRLIAGSRSPEPARLVVERLAQELPNSHRIVLEGVGHMGPVTHAAVVASHLPEMLLASERDRAA